MGFKFEELRVWEDSMAYTDLAYAIAAQLPSTEKFNLASQLRRAATSISLNIAEGSTSQSDPQTRKFLGYSIRSAVECVACHRLIARRGYTLDPGLLAAAEEQIQRLFRGLQAFRQSL